MFKHYLGLPLYFDVADSGSGTNENPLTSSGSTGGITSGTASEAMIKAAEAAESSTVADPTEGQVKIGDPASPGGPGKPPATAETPEQKAAKAAGSKPGEVAKPGATGEAPDSRIQAATRNARNQVIVDVSEALGMDPRTFGSEGIGAIKNSLSITNLIRQDAAGFVRKLAGELGLTVSGGKVDLADEKLPEPDLETADKSKRAYSAESITRILEIQRAQIMREMQPLREARESDDAGREEEARITRLTQVKDLALKEARQIPHFEENEAAIAEKLAKMDPRLKRSMGPIAAMHLAFGQVLSEKVFPSIELSAEQKVRDSMKKKAAGSSIVSPSGGSDATPPAVRPGDVEGLAARMRWMSEQASA